MVNWNPNGITLEGNVSIMQPYGIYININNTVYVADSGSNQILIWFNGNLNLSNTISGINSPYTVFTTITDNIYVGSSEENGAVNKWTLNLTTNILVMVTGSPCYGLFVDVSNTLYCSIRDNHQVVKKWLDDGMTTSAIIAGKTDPSFDSDSLNLPHGIFVDINFDLYVADSGNNRVQLFKLGQLVATTVAGNGASDTIPLSYPTGVVLDANNYLFIVDSGNNRIIGAGPNGFRCVIGCFGSGPAPNQLVSPKSMAFDSDGNIFVTDLGNQRIQKFVLATNSCSKCNCMYLSERRCEF
jgi:sugar lactone lactonase YvrE